MFSVKCKVYYRSINSRLGGTGRAISNPNPYTVYLRVFEHRPMCLIYYECLLMRENRRDSKEKNGAAPGASKKPISYVKWAPK